MSEPRFNVLISSAGRRVALMNIFRECLAEMGLSGELLAADMSRLSSAFHAADRAFQVPRCTAPEFVPTMLEICRQNEVRLLVPTLDPELPVYAANRQAFEEAGTVVSISTPEVIEIGSRKDRTHAWLTENRLPTVRQATADEVLANPADWTFPLVAKPVAGSASIGVALVRDVEELQIATQTGEYVVQSVAPGREHTVSVYCNRAGRPLCAVPRRRLEVRAGEVSKGMTVRLPELERLVFDLCTALPGPFGALNIQIFVDETTGEMNVIEINPRFGGGFPLAWEAGARYPQWLIEEILGRPSSARPDCWRDRVVMLRYDDAVFVDADDAGV